MKNEELRKVSLSDYPIPDEMLCEVGRLVATWNMLEDNLGRYIGKLAGFEEIDNQYPRMLFTHTSFPQKIDMLGTLCNHLVEHYPHLSVYKNVISKIRTAQKRRNEFVHNIIHYENEKYQLLMASARGTLKTEMKQITIEDIKRATCEIDDAMIALYDLVFQREIEPLIKRVDNCRNPK